MSAQYRENGSSDRKRGNEKVCACVCVCMQKVGKESCSPLQNLHKRFFACVVFSLLPQLPCYFIFLCKPLGPSNLSICVDGRETEELQEGGHQENG